MIKLKPISEIAASIGLVEDDLEYYGRYKAKVKIDAINRKERRENSALILVSAMTPTPAGEGKDHRLHRARAGPCQTRQIRPLSLFVNLP